MLLQDNMVFLFISQLKKMVRTFLKPLIQLLSILYLINMRGVFNYKCLKVLNE
jgi:hypothetical protein